MATLVLDRALRILDQLSRYDTRGLTLSDIARQADIPHPTVHRLLRDMVAARLVAPLPGGRGYVLGRRPFEHGLAARGRHDVAPLFTAHLQRLAEATGYAAYLFVLSGHEAVCYDHTNMQKLDPPLSVTVGGRRPLGVGAAGLALMAAQGDALIEAALRENAESLGRYGGLDVAALRALLAQTRALGYARSGAASLQWKCTRGWISAICARSRAARREASRCVSRTNVVDKLMTANARRPFPPGPDCGAASAALLRPVCSHCAAAAWARAYFPPLAHCRIKRRP